MPAVPLGKYMHGMDADVDRIGAKLKRLYGGEYRVAAALLPKFDLAATNPETLTAAG